MQEVQYSTEITKQQTIYLTLFYDVTTHCCLDFVYTIYNTPVSIFQPKRKQMKWVTLIYLRYYFLDTSLGYFLT